MWPYLGKPNGQECSRALWEPREAGVSGSSLSDSFLMTRPSGVSLMALTTVAQGKGRQAVSTVPHFQSHHNESNSSKPSLHGDKLFKGKGFTFLSHLYYLNRKDERLVREENHRVC